MIFSSRIEAPAAGDARRRAAPGRVALTLVDELTRPQDRADPAEPMSARPSAVAGRR